MRIQPLLKIIHSVIFIGVMTLTSFSQDFSGINTGSWFGVNSLYMNPANVVDSRFKVDINLFSLSGTFSNSYIGISKDALFDPSLLDQPNGMDTYLIRDTGVGGKDMFANFRIQGPSFMFNITKRDAIAFSTSVRSMGNINDLDYKLANILYEGVNSAILLNNFSDDYMAANSAVWAEYAFTYGRVILDKEEHFLKAGATVKLLQGLGAGYATYRNFNYAFSDLDTLEYLSGNLGYGQSNLNDFSFRFAGWGFGLDLGVVYEWRPDHQKFKYNMDGETNLWRRDLDKYKLKAGFSINDIGGMRFSKSDGSTDYLMNIQNLPLDYFDELSGPGDLPQYLANIPGMTVDSSRGNSFSMDLPTTINMFVDWRVVKGFYVNMNPFISLNNNRSDNNKVNYYHSLTLTPRYELPWFGAYMPISINSITNFNWGLSLRLGPIFVGSGTIFSNLLESNIKDADVHIGAKIPVPYGKPKDRDKDEVSDKKDKCPTVAGVWEFQGCPDTDKDGIQDSQDDCPTVPGLPAFKGCPDTDGDGLPDKDDKCPEEPGDRALNGCPDRDYDGIIDREDECPDEKGSVEFRGCPDIDGDGVIDKIDKCPTLFGPKEQFGCPDSDGDGIFDDVDACPIEKGLAENKGCPYADTDKDGIRDLDDMCPEQAGPAENKGCPYADSDGDGIIDLEDKCPKTPGVIENFGCPPIAKEEQEVLKKAFDNLEFASGKAIISTSSYASLDELAELLKKKTEFKLLIEGHTDNVGKRTTNVTLSKNRSNAVKTYLVKKGIDAARITTKWYGPDKPIDSNDTETGRQRNRRVEMTVVFD